MLEHVATGMRLSPTDPRTYVFHLFSAFAHLSAGRYEQAVDSSTRALHDKPNLLPAMRGLAIGLALAGRIDEARGAIVRMSALDPTLRLSNVGNLSPPYRRPQDRDRYIEGLRKAGLPE